MSIIRSLIFTAALLSLFSPASFAADKEWQFRVLLDGKEIGTHVFRLDEKPGKRVLQSEARFEVKFLFFTAYSYRHRNVEEWSGGCLQEIDATTVTNDKQQDVEGELRDKGFVVQKGGESAVLPECVMTFAYWNPQFLTQERLLNPQTGEYLDVDVQPLPETSLTVRGNTVQSRRFELRARDIELRVWYSDNDEWLALESTAKGGRILRYELI